MKTKTLKSVSHLSEIQALKRSASVFYRTFCSPIKRMSVNIYIGGLKRQI